MHVPSFLDIFGSKISITPRCVILYTGLNPTPHCVIQGGVRLRAVLASAEFSRIFV